MSLHLKRYFIKASIDTCCHWFNWLSMNCQYIFKHYFICKLKHTTLCKILLTKLSDSECVTDTLRSLSHIGSVQLASLWLTCSTSAALSSQIRCGLTIWIQASQKGREYGIPFYFHVMGESFRFFPLRVNLV